MIDIRAGVIPDDIEICAHIWVRALAHRDGMVEAEAMASQVLAAFEGPVVRFAVAGSPHAGFAVTNAVRANPSQALLHFLAVDPQYPGRGIGTRLLADAVEHSMAAGFASLLLDVRTDNVPAIGIYERAGFAPNGKPHAHPLGGNPMQPYRLRLR